MCPTNFRSPPAEKSAISKLLVYVHMRRRLSFRTSMKNRVLKRENEKEERRLMSDSEEMVKGEKRKV